jgi:hypothetical protein
MARRIFTFCVMFFAVTCVRSSGMPCKGKSGICLFVATKAGEKYVEKPPSPKQALAEADGQEMIRPSHLRTTGTGIEPGKFQLGNSLRRIRRNGKNDQRPEGQAPKTGRTGARRIELGAPRSTQAQKAQGQPRKGAKVKLHRNEFGERRLGQPGKDSRWEATSFWSITRDGFFARERPRSRRSWRGSLIG